MIAAACRSNFSVVASPSPRAASPSPRAGISPRHASSVLGSGSRSEVVKLDPSLGSGAGLVSNPSKTRVSTEPDSPSFGLVSPACSPSPYSRLKANTHKSSVSGEADLLAYLAVLGTIKKVRR